MIPSDLTPRERIQIAADLQVAAILAWSQGEEDSVQHAEVSFREAGIDYAGWCAHLRGSCGASESTARRWIAEHMRKAVDAAARAEFPEPVAAPDAIPDWMMPS